MFSLIQYVSGKQYPLAAPFPDALPEDVLHRRLERLIALQGDIIKEKTRAMTGKTYEILFESAAKGGGTRGKTRGNKDVIVKQHIAPGAVHMVRIEDVQGRTPIGQVIPQE